VSQESRKIAYLNRLNKSDLLYLHFKIDNRHVKPYVTYEDIEDYFQSKLVTGVPPKQAQELIGIIEKLLENAEVNNGHVEGSFKITLADLRNFGPVK